MNRNLLVPEVQKAMQETQDPDIFLGDFIPLADGCSIHMQCGCYLTEKSKFAEDAFGFLICPQHQQRRYGFLSLPKNVGKNANANYRFASWSPLEIEQYVVFGVVPARIKKPVALPQSTVVDKRDARDPEVIGNGILNR